MQIVLYSQVCPLTATPAHNVHQKALGSPTKSLGTRKKLPRSLARVSIPGMQKSLQTSSWGRWAKGKIVKKQFGIISTLGRRKAGRLGQVLQDGHAPAPLWQGETHRCHTDRVWSPTLSAPDRCSMSKGNYGGVPQGRRKENEIPYKLSWSFSISALEAQFFTEFLS